MSTLHDTASANPDLDTIRVLVDVTRTEWVDGVWHFRTAALAPQRFLVGSQTSEETERTIDKMIKINNAIRTTEQTVALCDWQRLVMPYMAEGGQIAADIRSQWRSMIKDGVDEYYDGDDRYEVCLSDVPGEVEKFRAPRIELTAEYKGTLLEDDSLKGNLTVGFKKIPNRPLDEQEDVHMTTAWTRVAQVIQSDNSPFWARASADDSPHQLLLKWEQWLKESLKSNINFSQPEWKTVSLVFTREPVANTGTVGWPALESDDA